MMTKKSKRKCMGTWAYKREWYVEVIRTEYGSYEFWLQNRNYDLKVYMFGVPSDEEQTLDEMLLIVEANLEEGNRYINQYNEELNYLEQRYEQECEKAVPDDRVNCMTTLTKNAAAMLEIAKTIDSQVSFQAIIGFLVDEWSAFHGLSNEDAASILTNVAEVQQAVWAYCGSPEQLR